MKLPICSISIFFTIEDSEPSAASIDSGFTLTTEAGQKNYANCDGDYVPVPSEATIRGQPLYYNAAKNRIAYYKGNKWSITSSTEYLSNVVLNGGTSGFYFSQEGKDPISCSGIWLPRYTVTAL